MARIVFRAMWRNAASAWYMLRSGGTPRFHQTLNAVRHRPSTTSSDITSPMISARRSVELSEYGNIYEPFAVQPQRFHGSAISATLARRARPISRRRFPHEVQREFKTDATSAQSSHLPCVHEVGFL